MNTHQYQLVLQSPGIGLQDFDRIINLEDRLNVAYEETDHLIDGHDFGSGTGNIFIDTNDPYAAFSLARQVICDKELSTIKAAYRSVEEDHYTFLWPENTTESFKLM